MGQAFQPASRLGSLLHDFTCLVVPSEGHDNCLQCELFVSSLLHFAGRRHDKVHEAPPTEIVGKGVDTSYLEITAIGKLLPETSQPNAQECGVLVEETHQLGDEFI